MKKKYEVYSLIGHKSNTLSYRTEILLFISDYFLVLLYLSPINTIFNNMVN